MLVLRRPPRVRVANGAHSCLARCRPGMVPRPDHAPPTHVDGIEPGFALAVLAGVIPFAGGILIGGVPLSLGGDRRARYIAIGIGRSTRNGASS